MIKTNNYGWSMFTPTDEVKPFDGTIDAGMYFIETDNCFPLKGNGWYYDDTIEKALNYNLIKKVNIILLIDIEKSNKHPSSGSLVQ